VPSQLPVDFAVRKGLVNLNQFPDYAQIAQRFRPGALVPFRYRVPGASAGAVGDWALPETQDFAMLFYRTDILQELGIKPPDTWEDVYATTPCSSCSRTDWTSTIRRPLAWR
jgi:ABC-type glycerol-3-phosphate transport system substrate-binding protein